MKLKLLKFLKWNIAFVVSHVNFFPAIEKCYYVSTLLKMFLGAPQNFITNQSKMTILHSRCKLWLFGLDVFIFRFFFKPNNLNSQRVLTREISCRDETRPGQNHPCLWWNASYCLRVLAEMKFHPGMNSSLSKISSRDEKKKKRRVNTSSRDEILK